MNEKLPITEADLQAYVDDCLPESRRADIEAYLTARPEDAERIESYRRQNAALHKLYDPVLDEPVPQRIADMAQQPAVSGWHRLPVFRIAATAAWIGLGTLLGWNLRESPIVPTQTATRSPALQTVALARGAALAHATFVPEKRHPVEVAADQEAHLVKWLSSRMGKDVRVPVLTEQGYALVGGRLLPSESGPAAQFMYEDPRGVRLTLYLKTEAKTTDTAFRFADENGISVFYWIDGDFGYALSGTLEKSRVLEIAKVVYGHIKH